MSTWLGEKLSTHSGFDSLEQELYLSLQHTADLLVSEFNQLLKPSKLSSALYNVLRILRGADKEGLPCREISNRMITHDPDVTRLVDRLLKRKLVERHRQDEDRRVVKVKITKAGLKLLAELDKPVAELHSKQLGKVGKKNLRDLAQLLEKVRNQ